MPRVIILVLDSLGIGSTPDADSFGDAGANTLGHIAQWCAEGNHYSTRASGPLRLPILAKLGLGKANELASGIAPAGLDTAEPICGLYAACEELSTGKDTPSGHWEIAGVPVRFDWGYFPKQEPCFPDQLINNLLLRTGLKAILGNCHSSGLDIIKSLGKTHVETGYPICYTSADSVFQIAAHEKSFGLQKLYDICEISKELLDEYNIARVIARPFIGDEGSYQRTGNRRDYTTPPHADTLLDKLVAAGREVHSVGKIADIFAHRGITHQHKATGHDALFDETLKVIKTAADGGLIFTNFVEFDQSFGHRRNTGGYAAALEHFDQRLAEVMSSMQDDDMLILTADHGCDPVWEGSDHTREHIPFLLYRPGNLSEVNAGIRSSFCDIGQSVAQYLAIAPLTEGVSVFDPSI